MKTYERRRSGRGPSESCPEVVNLDEVCRLCLGREERDENRVAIFGNGESVPLALRIMACVALEVLEDDGLPTTICKPCHYQLEKYYIFRKKCKSSDLKLRMHLKRLADSGIKSEEEKLDSSPLDELNEEELVGASVTIAIPEDGEGEMELDEVISETDEGNDITLPQDMPSDSRQACTIKQELLDDYDKYEERQIVEKIQTTIDDSQTYEIEQNEQCNINLNDAANDNDQSDEYLQVRVLPTTESELTHVEVTTGEGSVLLMELTTEEPLAEKGESGEMLIFKCEQCPKAFSRMVELKRHMSIHSLQRGITCGVCDKWFASHSSYTRHERIHTGIKPYQCGVCERRFTQKEVLLRHMLVHSGVKPFNCHICKKGFTQRQTLQMHMVMKHSSGQRNVCLHKCPLCTKVFCHASGLSRHLGSHAGRVYKCLNCDKLFNDKSSLRRHHKMTGHQSIS